MVQHGMVMTEGEEGLLQAVETSQGPDWANDYQEM